MSKQATQDFFMKVVELRAAQKKYYETRDFRDLSKAKKIEKEVDAIIDRGLDYISKWRESQLTQTTLQFSN